MRRFVTSLLLALLVSFAPAARAQDDGLVVTNAAQDTLLYAAPDGFFAFGPADARVTVGSGGEGLWSIVTRAENSPSAGLFQIRNPDSRAIALFASTTGSGWAVNGSNWGTGPGGLFYNMDAGGVPALIAEAAGSGPALLARRYDPNPDATIARFAVGRFGSPEDTEVAAIRGSGNIWTRGSIHADGTISSGGADFAERFEVVGDVATYEPGDVLAISSAADRHLERAAEPYSRRIAGVYATKPGVLLGELAPASSVPVGVVGVVATKVTDEGGPIRRGDLLVTSSTPGHAMKGDLDRIGVGMVIGRALQDYAGAGAGMIEVLVNVQ